MFALVLLFLIYRNVRGKLEQILPEQRLFLGLIQLNGLILIFDTLMWILDGKTGFGVRESYFIVTVLYYLFNPGICMLWYFYVDYQIHKSVQRLKKILLPMAVPFLVSAVLTFLSPMTGLFFTIDQQNVYHRGPLFLLMAALSYFYLVYAMVSILAHHKSIGKRTYLPLLLFALLPSIGGIFQTFYYGLSVIWVCNTISIFIIFINIQNDQLYTDYLTGLFNRRQLDAYLQQQMQSKAAGLAGIMLDLDNFKEMNDRYGHAVGDLALRHFAGLLRKSFGKRDFIARYGGDEFVIILRVAGREELASTLDLLKQNLEEFNKNSIMPFPFHVSVGYDMVSSFLTADEFLRRIDYLMYQDKKRSIFVY